VLSQPITWLILTKLNIKQPRTTKLNKRARKLQHIHNKLKQMKLKRGLGAFCIFWARSHDTSDIWPTVSKHSRQVNITQSISTRCSQGLMQSVWNKCWHGRLRTTSPRWKSSMQTLHWLSLSATNTMDTTWWQQWSTPHHMVTPFTPHCMLTYFCVTHSWHWSATELYGQVTINPKITRLKRQVQMTVTTKSVIIS